MKSLKFIAAATVLAASSSVIAADDAFAPMTDEQIKAQRAEIQKAQDEAYQRHVEAMKQWQAQMQQPEPAPTFQPAVAEFPAFEQPAWVTELEAKRGQEMNEMPAWPEIPAIGEDDFQAPEVSFEKPEKPEWVKEIEAKRAERTVPAFGEAPKFEDMDAKFEKPEKPEWVKVLEAQREERMQTAGFEMPTFEESAADRPDWVKEADAKSAEKMNEMPAFESKLPTEEEMAAAHDKFIQETDARRAESDKAYQERVAASKKRHAEFVSKFITKAETTEAPAAAPAAAPVAPAEENKTEAEAKKS